MATVLAGDVGGTKTVLALYAVNPDGTARELRAARFGSAEFPGLAEVCRTFLGEAQTRIDAAAFGVAGPVAKGKSNTTNLPWQLDERALSAHLEIQRVSLINDFQAISLGIPSVAPDDLDVLQDVDADDGPIAVIGAGTGLGESVVVGRGASARVLASEGGHCTYAPRDETEIALQRFLSKRFPDHVSVERVVSGRGLVDVYEFVVESGLEKTEDATRELLERRDPGAVIGEAALLGSDRACVRAVALMVSAYGAEAGNLALKVLPTGGVFVAGGIAPKILPRISDGSFMSAFLAKGRMRPVLERIRVSVVLDEHVGLIGARNKALTLLSAVTAGA